ncbi:unnamed protein product [Rotaria sp. Silwood2]|nr:unnamed protein product [Rotaria sp. Silwood2]CAF4065659.1 unnamed protein product [Rotaria sp. Silwood2]CAF4679288.1 unnamed protein product [Rotaria sp. Silwood2]
MQKTARVASRNIQFINQVQIKEITTDDYELDESTRRLSWDPNLNNKDVFKATEIQQRNIIIAFIVVGIVLVAIIIGIVVGVTLSQKKITTTTDQSLTYNEVCKTGSNQCKSSQGLYCPYGFCSCTSPYSWNTATSTCTLLTYNRACSASNQCNSLLGLICTNQICQCDSYHSWDTQNNTCKFEFEITIEINYFIFKIGVIIVNNTLTYGDKCVVGSSQCNSSVELTCTGNCTCRNSKIWNISTCVCPAGTFLNSSNLCQTTYRDNESCLIGSNQCDSTRGLSCYNNSRCQCDSTKYWNRNSEICLQRVNYSDFCASDSDCVPTLICPTVAGVCNCSRYLPDYVCNCPNTKYYDSATQQCVDRATYNGTCIASANYTCLVTLYCNAGLCACPMGTSWIAANSTCA